MKRERATWAYGSMMTFNASKQAASNEEDELEEAFVVEVVIVKLPPFWLILFKAISR
jgi:hypothetical protein